MGDYYNTTRGPLSVTLNDGSSCAVSPKSWIYVAPGNESSASITKLVQKGFLVRSSVARTAAEVPPAPLSAPAAPAVVPALKPEPKLEPSEAKPEPKTEVASTSSMKEEIFRKKR
jgi:hypothetical protein